MLGKIELDPWQCVAELIDNSIDAFAGHQAEDKKIEICVPSLKKLKQGEGIVIQDNGPGMSLDQLENALRAGWSGRDSSQLGLFGMGFNIATARLGVGVEVWTSTSGEDEDVGVRLDYAKIWSHRDYNTEVRRRPKGMYPSGTAIVIYGIAEALIKKCTEKRFRSKLSAAYNYQKLLEREVKILLNGKMLRPSSFCVWSDERYVVKDGQKVYAKKEFDFDLGDKWFCESCLDWRADVEELNPCCSICGQSTSLVLKDCKGTGWLGIQRYHHPSDFGVSFIRNGRVILDKSKSVFKWTDPNGLTLVEYPIDQSHYGGRIVGEVFVDFLTPVYTKDAFSEGDVWSEVMARIRGKGPLVTKKAREFGFEKNSSHLGRLFHAYRRSHPAGIGNLVLGDSNGSAKLELARGWGQLFHQGDPPHLTDEKWYNHLLEMEAAGNSDDDTTTGGFDLPNGEAPSKKQEEEEHVPVSVIEVKTYSLDSWFSLDPIEVSVTESSRGVNDVRLVVPQRKSRGKWEMCFNADSNWRDWGDEEINRHVCAELALIWHGELPLHDVPISLVTNSLREKYWAGSDLKGNELRRAIQNFIRGIISRGGWAENVVLESASVSLSDDFREAMELKVGAQALAADFWNHSKRIRFSGDEDFCAVCRTYPEVLFNGNHDTVNLNSIRSLDLRDSISNYMSQCFDGLHLFLTSESLREVLFDSSFIDRRASLALRALQAELKYEH